MGVNCTCVCVCVVTNMARFTLCHEDDGGGGVAVGALPECQSHFGQTTVVSVNRWQQKRATHPSQIRAEA